MDPVPVVLVGEEFWRGILDFERLVDEGVIAPRDPELVSYAETAEEIFERILAWYGVEPGARPSPQALAERRRAVAQELFGAI